MWHLYFWHHTVSHCVEADATVEKHMGRNCDNKRQAGLRTFNSEGVGQGCRRVWRHCPWLVGTLEGVNQVKASSMTGRNSRVCEPSEGIIHDWWNDTTSFWVGNMGRNNSGKSEDIVPFKVCSVWELSQAQGSSKGGNWWSLGLRWQGWKQSYKPHERMWLDKAWTSPRVLISAKTAQPWEDR